MAIFCCSKLSWLNRCSNSTANWFTLTACFIRSGAFSASSTARKLATELFDCKICISFESKCRLIAKIQHGLPLHSADSVHKLDLLLGIVRNKFELLRSLPPDVWHCTTVYRPASNEKSNESNVLAHSLLSTTHCFRAIKLIVIGHINIVSSIVFDDVGETMSPHNFFW